MKKQGVMAVHCQTSADRGAWFWAVLLCMLFGVVTGCGSGGSGGGGGGGAAGTVEVAAVIGRSGGEVAVSGTGSPADGAKVILPAGALAASRTITISHGETDLALPAAFEAAGGQIDFGPDGIAFDLPVHIAVPYPDDDNDGVVDGTTVGEYALTLIYYNAEAGAWEAVPIVNTNARLNVVEAETSHFSTYLVAVDTTTTDDGTDDTAAAAYQSGEYFVGPPTYLVSDGVQELIVKGCINQAGPCATPYVLTVTTENGVIKGVVDRHTTTTGGVPATLGDDGRTFVFNAAGIFEKIQQSGNAALWTWRCEFIAEHTHVRGYAACDDSATNAICTGAGQRVTAGISVMDNARVAVDLGIEISDMDDAAGRPTPNGNFGTGDRIAVRFEANYN